MKLNPIKMTHLLFAFSFSWGGLLTADFDDHLKKAMGKDLTDKSSTLRNIDFIYMINLDQRPEKWKLSIDQLTPYGITPYRFSAVNGWELSLEDINDIGVKFSPEMEGDFMATCYHRDGNFEPSHEPLRNFGQTYFCHCMARGTMGIALSHLSVLQDAYDSGFETVWVMEDDINVVRDPRILCDLIDRLDALVGKTQWDILFTDKDMLRSDGTYNPCYWAARRPDITTHAPRNDYAMRIPVSKEFWKIGARYGAHSMIVRRSGMRKLLQYFKAHQIYLPYDLEFILPLGIKLYAVLQDVVTNLPKALSDNGGPNYLQKEEQ